jgi:alanine-glyoxylate transaminase/serine-glyoxylate transaminase/serine-pyruvate transaminase
MIKDLNPKVKILMGPGPSDVSTRVLKAMATPTIGHLDPEFLGIMNETMDMLRRLFKTKNQITVAMSGTGSSGMETCFVNLVEPGDKVVVCVNGLFGERMVDVASRCGAEVIELKEEWGKVISPEKLKETLEKNDNVKIVALVHAETSTGAHQPMDEITKIVKDYGALLLLDTVTSLGGTEVKIDDWKVDAVYSGTQKCLSCPPGLSPVSFSDAAVEKLMARKSKVASWYLDLSMIKNYWGQERVYHHTAPINMLYGLRESLRLIEEEGLDNRIQRHKELSELLVSGLEDMGLKMVVDKEYRLPMLNSVWIPEGIQDAKVRGKLLNEYGVEIGGGLGIFKGKVWRIGLMGESCSKRNVTLLLSALNNILKEEGYTR